MMWKTKGMNQDLSVSAFNPEFAFENKNLRLATNDGNTTLSWVNEKGTGMVGVRPSIDGPISYDYTLPGTPIGTAVFNDKFVVFTHDTGTDYIIRFTGDSSSLIATVLYSGNLNFDTEHPLETLVSYENDIVQKVYWTDGVNQPRVINVSESMDDKIGDYTDTSFDFVPTLELNETIKVKKILGGGGSFAPGVIQYAFTYYNKYGQESNIFYTTPLMYVSYKDRGASPEDTSVDNTFKIFISNFDNKFDFLRVYSIQRTSINGVPIVRRVQDLDLKYSTPTNGSTISFLDLTSDTDGVAPYSLIINNVETDIDHQDRKEGYVFKDGATIGGKTAIWMGLTKKNFRDLIIKNSDSSSNNLYNTWSKESSDDNVLWVSGPTRVVGENEDHYYIVCTKSATDLTTVDFLTNDIPFVDVISFTDTGYSGNTVDPTELLYKGGDEIKVSTMEQKDGVLFFGNINLSRKTLETSDIATNVTLSETTRSITPLKVFDSPYYYANQLSSIDSEGYSTPCSGFKRGDYYRFGVQFQHKTGRWSDPIYIDDKNITKIPSVSGSNLSLPAYKGEIGSSFAATLKESGYVRVRGVVCFPEAQDRVTLCQGVINPTMYSQKNYENNSVLKAQSSWFFRTKQSDYVDNNETVAPYWPSTNQFLPYMSTAGNPSNIRSVEIQGDFEDDKFTISTNLVTFHSPDLEFDPAFRITNLSGLGYRKAGDATISNTLSDINIVTETPNIASGSSGYIHKSFNKSGNYGIVTGLFYEDWIVDDDNAIIQAWTEEKSPVKYFVYPWQKTGSLNNDINRPSDKGISSAVLKQKVISNLRYTGTLLDSSLGSCQSLENGVYLFAETSDSIVKVDDSLYYGNVNTVLSPTNADGMYYMFTGSVADDYKNPREVPNFNAVEYYWKTFAATNGAGTPYNFGLYLYNNNDNLWEYKNQGVGNVYSSLVLKKDMVRMKYKSTPHLILNNNFSSLWPSSGYNNKMPVLDICREDTPSFRNNLFGGKTQDALMQNMWLPCGEPVRLDDVHDDKVTYYYSYGDTYYQRWDCLKTYAYTPEDENQIVEIGSFMLETRVNIDGRYDRNRGQVNNTMMSPLNFNLMNLVYSQRDNFFNYRIQDADYYKSKSYPNQITWSLAKESGAEIDAWTNINLGSVLELDGDKGSISKLIRYNDQLLAFQDSGISQILYNENVQIASTTGVPIEIANSQKVEGKRYLSDSIGCTNKWSLVSTPAGIYFMDSNNKGIYHLSDGVKNLSLEQGFNTWSKKNIQAGKIWNPDDFEKNSSGFGSFVSYYDRQNQDVLFIDENYCLAFSEKFGIFTSFYSYEKAPYFINYKDTGLWLSKSREENADSNYHIYQHNGDEYCEFFGKPEEYYMELIGNPEPLVDKIFTNLEFRACVDGEGVEVESTPYAPYIPFDSLYAENEYQKGELKLQYKHGLGRMQHYHRETSEGEVVDSSSPLNRKFRIWRCDIPRNNKGGKPLDRMRNTWLKVKLTKTLDTGHRVEIHDMVMTYYV